MELYIYMELCVLSFFFNGPLRPNSMISCGFSDILIVLLPTSFLLLHLSPSLFPRELPFLSFPLFHYQLCKPHWSLSCPLTICLPPFPLLLLTL